MTEHSTSVNTQLSYKMTPAPHQTWSTWKEKLRRWPLHNCFRDGEKSPTENHRHIQLLRTEKNHGPLHFLPHYASRFYLHVQHSVRVVPENWVLLLWLQRPAITHVKRQTKHSYFVMPLAAPKICVTIKAFSPIRSKTLLQQTNLTASPFRPTHLM